MKPAFAAWIAMFAVVVASALAQDATSVDELESKLRALEKRVQELEQGGSNPELDEIRRQIEILTREIEGLRVQQQEPALADQSQYGLGAAASKVYRTNRGVSIGGYGEMLYENFDSTKENGTASGRTDQIDFLRAVVYTGYKFNDKTLLNTEIEFEHATTGDAIGEVSVEFAYLDYLARPEIGVRTGLVLIPMGFLNELHEPTAFLGARRPDVERLILPTTWREAGLGAFGEAGSFTYRAYLVTGLDSTDMTASGIRNARQKGAKAKAEDFALTGRLDWSPQEGILLGASAYSGGSGQGRTTPAGESFDGTVTIFDLHAEARVRGLALRGLWADGSIDDAAEINEANRLTGSRSVGESFEGWYLEAGYDIAPHLKGVGSALTPFARIEQYDPQASVPDGYTKDPGLDTEVLTLGISWKPMPQIAVKAEYQDISTEADTGVDQFNVAIGYVF